MARGPIQSGHSLLAPGQTSTAPPATMSSIPSTMRRSAFSLKITQASTAVSTAQIEHEGGGARIGMGEAEHQQHRPQQQSAEVDGTGKPAPFPGCQPI